MASAKILQRAETAMEIGEDFLVSDEDDDDDADEGSENMPCSEDADEERGEGEDEAHDDKQPSASESAASKHQQKNQKQDENASTSNSTPDGKTKKSEKGLVNKLKNFVGVMRPSASKLQWEAGLNIKASNRDSQPNSDNAGNRKQSSRPPKDEEKINSPIDTAEIKRLRKENKRLEKLADKFLNEIIQLKTRIGELSEVDGQLAATRSCYDSLKAELKESQNNRESLLNKIDKQSEEHCVEFNRLNEELKITAKDLLMMEQEKKSIEEKYKLNEDALSSMKEELEKLKAELITNEENHYSEMNRLTEDLRKAEEEKSRLTSQHQYKVNEFERRIKDVQNRKQTAEAEVNRLNTDLKKIKQEKTVLINEHQRTVSKLQTTNTDLDYRRNLAEREVNRLSAKVKQLEYEKRNLSSQYEDEVNRLNEQLRQAQYRDQY